MSRGDRDSTGFSDMEFFGLETKEEATYEGGSGDSSLPGFAHLSARVRHSLLDDAECKGQFQPVDRTLVVQAREIHQPSGSCRHGPPVDAENPGTVVQNSKADRTRGLLRSGGHRTGHERRHSRASMHSRRSVRKDTSGCPRRGSPSPWRIRLMSCHVRFVPSRHRRRGIGFGRCPIPSRTRAIPLRRGHWTAPRTTRRRHLWGIYGASTVIRPGPPASVAPAPREKTPGQATITACRGCSSEAEHQLPKLRTRVRFSSPALAPPRLVHICATYAGADTHKRGRQERGSALRTSGL